MKRLKQVLLMLATTTVVFGQRPSFAGHRPIGYPDYTSKTTPAPAAGTDELGNRFGDGENTNVSTTSTTTERLPIEALGDRDLVNRLSKLPIDQQPFWFINWKAIEAHNRRPQTYPQRPNPFAPSGPSNGTKITAHTGSINTANHENLDSNSNLNNAPPNKSDTGTRDVDVSALMNNNNILLGSGGPINDNTDSANENKKPTQHNDETLNRNTNVESTARPTSDQKNKVLIAEAPNKPYPISDPKTKDPYQDNSKRGSSPHLATHTDRIKWNDMEQRKTIPVAPYKFERQSPLWDSYGFRRIEHPLYYLK